MLFLFSIVLAGVGLAFDLTQDHGPAFWIGAQPGARAVIGIAAGVLIVAAAHVLRALLGRNEAAEALKKGARRAGDHA